MTQATVNPVPNGMHTITPHLVCAGAAAAIDFYKKAFNAVEMSRLPGKDGKLMHAMIRIGDSQLMLGDEFPDWGAFGPKALKGSSVTIHLQVENVDAILTDTSAQSGVCSYAPRTTTATSFSVGARCCRVPGNSGIRF